MNFNLRYCLFILLMAIGFVQCTFKSELPQGDNDNGGLFLPSNFEAVVVIDSIDEKARHITVNEDGDVYLKLRNSSNAGSVAVLQDKDNDGRADIIEKFARYGRDHSWSQATGIKIYNGYLYYSSSLAVYRLKLKAGQIVPEGEPEIILRDDHAHGNHEHIAKPIAFDNKGYMYISFGAPSNACQELSRTPGSFGIDPCPQLEEHGGIWRFEANKINQTQRDGYKYATGIRNVVAMDWNSEDENLYVVMHGRDDLLLLFPEIYSPWASAMLPAEEFLRVTEGSNFGWPYCYYDQLQERKVLAPEYGGDSKIIGRCDQYDVPIMSFPGHWAPNGLAFYKGNGGQFPERYKNGAFITFHGSTNRGPYPQSGYFVGFVPFKNGKITGDWEVFADGFSGVEKIINVSDASYRPMGIAEGPDGSLYLSDTEKGKVWRVMYKGEKNTFGEKELSVMEKRKNASHIRTPDSLKDNLISQSVSKGQIIYATYCSACHQNNGKGAPGRFPPLTQSKWVTQKKSDLIEILLNGMQGDIEVNGEHYNGLMPSHVFLKDDEIAHVLSYIRSNFGNNASEISENEVYQIRKNKENTHIN